MKSRWKRCQMSSPPYFRTSRYFRLPSCRTLRFRRNHQKEEENRAWEVLERLELRECIGGLPNGIHTALRWNGSSERAKLSGGEEQKLALARALFAQRGAYILDEPSAALDSKSEIALYDFFQEADGTKDRNLRVPQAI